ncbi:MAG: class I SAM-dependent methyltransferase [Candidatus Thorarchaeota archaeon]
MVNNRYLVDPKKRFSSRVENYIKYRPHYPPVILDFMRDIKILTNNSIIADIGSGTGILSKILLKNGNKVYGIEPNDEMRKGAERYLKDYENFVSIEGSAENIPLPNFSIDLITAAQSFHWFNEVDAKHEFKRILKPDGFIAIIWNNRKKTGRGFSSQYEEFILKYSTDYKEVRKNEKKIDNFFDYKKKVFYNYQDLDYKGLKGRLLSVSYIPIEEGPKYDKMLWELQSIYNEYEIDGRVRLEYDTEIYYGQLN